MERMLDLEEKHQVGLVLSPPGVASSRHVVGFSCQKRSDIIPDDIASSALPAHSGCFPCSPLPQRSMLPFRVYMRPLHFYVAVMMYV